jgi:hypothetical protein
MEASSAEGDEGGYLRVSRLAPGELVGVVAAAVLALSIFLPWFSTSSSNPNSRIEAGHPATVVASGGDTASAWITFPILRWFLLAGCSAPFILAWIVARGHKLTWRPGEVTMIVGVTAIVLVLCNGIILGKPANKIDLSFSYGYLVALLGAAGIAAGGFLRQTQSERGRKPPGTL